MLGKRLSSITLAALISGAGLGVDAHADSGRALVVPGDFGTIQAAVDAAHPGDVVRLRPGTYQEQVVVKKDLRIVGAGAPLTVIVAPDTLTPSEFAPPWIPGYDPPSPRAAVVTVTGGATVEISGLTVTGAGQTGCLGMGIDVLRSATLRLHDAAVAHIHNRQPCHGIGILIGRRPDVVGGPLGAAHADVSDVAVTDIETYSIRLDGFDSTAAIRHNTIRDGGTGIDIRHGIATITENTISRQFCAGHLALCGPDPINDIQASGTAAGFLKPGTVIRGNRVSDVDAGVYLLPAGAGCIVSHNEIRDAGAFGYGIQDGNSTVSDSSIEGGGVGVAVAADAADTIGTLEGLEIGETGGPATKTFSCCGFSATVVRRPHRM